MFGSYVETWTHGEYRGVEGIDSRLARRQVEGFKSSEAYNVTEDEELGQVRVEMPGAIDLTFIYYFPRP
jgi:hypothetical protein